MKMSFFVKPSEKTPKRTVINFFVDFCGIVKKTTGGLSNEENQA